MAFKVFNEKSFLWKTKVIVLSAVHRSPRKTRTPLEFGDANQPLNETPLPHLPPRPAKTGQTGHWRIEAPSLPYQNGPVPHPQESLSDLWVWQRRAGAALCGCQRVNALLRDCCKLKSLAWNFPGGAQDYLLVQVAGLCCFTEVIWFILSAQIYPSRIRWCVSG